MDIDIDAIFEKYPDPITDAMDYISKRIESPESNHLLVEVIVYALQAMKNDPELSIQSAFEEGCYEWDV